MSLRPDMATVFHERSYGRFIEVKGNLMRKKIHTNLVKRNGKIVWKQGVSLRNLYDILKFN